MTTFMQITRTVCCVLLATAAVAVAAGEPPREKEKAIVVRPLKFTPKDATIAFRIGGQTKVTTLADAAAVEKLVGKDAVKALVTGVDFDKEKIVLVSWTTSGPPEGTLKHDVTGMGNDRKVTFFVKGPPNTKVRGQRARIGADFFAVPKSVTVAFDPNERK